MCYHKEEKFTAKEVKKHYNIHFPEEANFAPRAEVNGFNHEPSPIITRQAPGLIQLFNWGLFPSWSKDLNIQNYTLNAKAETLSEKRSFKDYLENRCLVPSTGLFEWETKGKVKEKNLIKAVNQPIFSLAGLWNSCEHPVTGQPFNTFTCVTLDGFVAILKDEKAWLNEGKIIVDQAIQWIPLVNPQLTFFE